MKNWTFQQKLLVALVGVIFFLYVALVSGSLNPIFDLINKLGR